MGRYFTSISHGRFAGTICGDVLLVYYCIYTSTHAREIPMKYPPMELGGKDNVCYLKFPVTPVISHMMTITVKGHLIETFKNSF